VSHILDWRMLLVMEGGRGRDGVERCTNREDLIDSTPALEIDYFAEVRTPY